MEKLLYPLKSSSLGLILIVSASIWLGHINLAAFVLQITVFAVFVPAFAKFLFNVADHTFDGNNKPPAIESQLFNPFKQWRHIHLLLWLAVCFLPANILARNNQEALFWLYHTLILMILPAYIAVLCASGSIFAPLNPLKWLHFIKVSARQYGSMCVTLLGLGFIGENLYSNQLYFIGILIYLYTLVLGFHWVGHLMLAFRYELDIVPNASRDWDEERERLQLQKHRGQCLQLIYEQRHMNNVAALIDKHITLHESEPLQAHRWFHEKLVQWEDKRTAITHAAQYQKILEQAGKTAAAQMLAENIKTLNQ